MALEKIETKQNQVHHLGMLSVGYLIQQILKLVWVSDSYFML